MSINEIYKFISKGDWFKRGTEAKVVDDCFWKRGEGYDKEVHEPDDDILSKKENYFGLFEGTRISNSSNELHKKDEEYLDEEVCSLEEFEVIKIKKEENKEEKKEKEAENVVCQSASAQ